jgi:hypothetical protein
MYTGIGRFGACLSPFVMISLVVRCIMDAVCRKYPNASHTDVVRQCSPAFEFSCLECGALERAFVELAVAGKWLQDMNPEGPAPVSTGPSVAALSKGRCPKCNGKIAQVSFDPTVLHLE